MWTWVFWRATIERAISGGAAVVLTAMTAGVVAGGDGNTNVNAFLLDYRVLFGLFLGGAMVQVLLALSAQGISHNGPGFGQAEVLNPAEVQHETGTLPKPPDYVTNPDGPDHRAGGEAG